MQMTDQMQTTMAKQIWAKGGTGTCIGSREDNQEKLEEGAAKT